MQSERLLQSLSVHAFLFFTETKKQSEVKNNGEVRRKDESTKPF